jgi:hypothetical protein
VEYREINGQTFQKEEEEEEEKEREREVHTLIKQQTFALIESNPKHHQKRNRSRLWKVRKNKK